MSSHEHLWKKGFSKPNSTPVPNPFKIQRRRVKALSPNLSQKEKLQLKQQADQISQLGYNTQNIPINAPDPTTVANPSQSKSGEVTHQQTTPAADAVDIQADALDEQDQEETNERDEISLAAASDGSASDDTRERQEISDSETEGIAEPQVNSVENQEEETDIQAKAEQPARNFLELPINAPGTSPSSIQRQVNFRGLGNSIQQQPVETEEKVEPEAEEELQESDETIQRQEIPDAEEDKISSSEPPTVQRQSETPDTPDQETEKSEDNHNFLEIPVNVPGTPLSSIPRQVNLGKFTNSFSQQIQPASHPKLNQLNAFQTGEFVQPQRIQSPVKPVNPILNQTQTNTETVQKKGTPQSSDAGEAEAAPNLEQEIQQKRGRGQPISNKIRQPMEQAFGADFSQVQVHTDSKSNKLNESIQAKAFTTGTDIFFKQGEYQPDNQPGQELLAHELTHVVQQNGSKVQAKTDSQVATKGNKLQTKERLVSGFPTQLKIQRRENPQEQTVKENKPQPAQPTPAPAPESGGDMAPATPQVANEGGSAAAPAIPEEAGKAPATQGGNQQAAGAGGASATPGGGGSKSPSSPEEDPAFKGVVNKAKGVADKEKQHDPAEAESKEAQDAAEPPANELESKAQNKQVGEMNQQQPGAFNAQAFKAKLMEKIGAIIPDNEEDAKKFKESNQLDSVKQDVSSQVTDEEKKAASPIEEKTKAAPDTSGVEPKPVTPMQPPEAGAAPTDINAEKAAPKPKPDAEVSAPFEANSQELDNELGKAKVPEETLEKSNEPQFVEALSAKKEAQTHAKEAPQTYSRDEKATINKAEAEAQTTSQTQLQGMHGERSQLLNQVMGAQSETQGKDTQERTKIANEINGFYQDTKKNVEDVLSNIDDEVTKKFDAGAATAKQIFENYVDQKMEAWEDERYGEWYDVTGWDERVSDSWHGLPPEVNQFFVDGRQKYLDSMDGTLTDIANFVAQKLNEAKEKIAEGKQKIQEHVANLPENLRKVGQDAAQSIQGKFDQLEESVNSKQDELIDSLAQKYRDNLQELDADIEKRKEENKGLKDKAKDAIVGTVETIMQLKDMLMGVLAKAAGAIDKIILDPIQFLGNLVSGIKQGFQKFVGNIWEHLKKGLLGWLTGTMAKSGIQMPESFDLKGIFTLVMQVLGLAYDGIKSRTIKALGKNGEKMFNGLEKTFEVFVILKNEGLAGLWQFIQDKIGDLKVMVIDTIQNFVIESVIKQGVLWVISLLNPASAFAKACKMIYDIIMFFIERGSQIVELVNAVMESVTAIANGALGGAAKLIENALSKALPVVISFMASLLGLGGISKKIQEIIQTVKGPIDKAIGWLISQAVKFAKKIGKKLGFGKDKGKGKKEGENQNENEGERLEDSEVGKTVNFSGGGKNHRLWINTQGTSTTVMVASTPTSVEAKLNEWQGKLDSLPEDKRPQAQKLLGTARQHLSTTDQKAQKTAKEMEEAKQNSTDEKAIKEAEQADNQTEAEEETLADVLQQLFELFGEGNTLVEWWKVNEQFNTKDGKTHKLFFLGEGENAKLAVASHVQLMEELLSKKEKDLSNIENRSKKMQLESALSQAIENFAKVKSKRNEIEILQRQPKASNRKTKLNGLEGELESLLMPLAKALEILGVGVTEEREDVRTYIRPEQTGAGGRAGKVVADPLSKYPGNTSGSRPKVDPPGWNSHIKTIPDYEKYYSRLHIVSEKLHGPGNVIWNLTPGKDSENQRMEAQAERPAQKLVEQGNVLWYEGTVTYRTEVGYTDFAKKINIRYGFKEKDDNGQWKRVGNIEFNQDFEVTKPDPKGTRDSIPTLSTVTQNWLNTSRPHYLPQKPMRRIISKRDKAGKTYASFDDFLNSPEVQDESDKIIENVRRAINEGFLKEK
ncbi:eCIS core domain-containing protein [Coleofasciculus sp.]|uniref:eCIS core domain-containing protein n=1 Tax=Coleofasciculus sp. TaxID=3100458 RepID=UPI003A48B813